MTEKNKNIVAEVFIFFLPLIIIAFFVGRHAFPDVREPKCLAIEETNIEASIDGKKIECERVSELGAPIKALASQCTQAFKKDFPEYQNTECFVKGQRDNWTYDCLCKTWDIKDAWDKENTKYEGVRENFRSHYFDLK